MDLDRLNKEQREAVLADEDALLILAGAGSGKTRVLTSKIAYQIQDLGVKPWQVLAFTFTNKAAGEMKERVGAALGRPVDAMWIGTFHSICARILRREIDRLGYTSSFTIYDAADQKTLVKQLMKDPGLAAGKLQPGYVLSEISKAKNAGLSPEAYREEAADEFAETIASLYRCYESALKKANALDFDDLILKATQLMETCPQVRDKYQEQFQYIFVDEYQDTNHAQYQLILSFMGKTNKITVVGDIDQSIYGWRGADISNILNFERDFKTAKTLLLEQNYRSTKKILEASNQLIANNQERRKKRLWTENEEGEPVHFQALASDFDEALAVVGNMRVQQASGYAWKDLAVLYRTNAQSRPIEEALIREGIPYRIVGGVKFYDRREIKDLIAYMQLLVNPSDDVSFRRVVNMPKRGIGATSLAALERLATEDGLSLLDGLNDPDLFGRLTPGQRDRFQPFMLLMARLREQMDLPLPDLVEKIYQESGYKAMLEVSQAVEDQSRIENIESFLEAIGQYQEEEGGNLVDYLQTLSLMSDLDKAEDREEGVQLMTVHSAKGLEFPIVYLVGLEEGLFPSRRTVEEGGLEEERRLMYVAMTRAESKLFISQAQTRRLYGETMPEMPSRFIEEIADLLDVAEGPDQRTSLRRVLDDFEPYGAGDYGSGAYGQGHDGPSHGMSGHDSTGYGSSGYGAGSGRSDGYGQLTAGRPQPWGDSSSMRKRYDQQRERIRQMAQARKQAAEKNLSGSYRVGDKVRHRRLGQGTVVAVKGSENGDELTIAFENKGLKRLNADLAPLTKIED